MIREHAILSLSGAHIWLECAPSARFQEQIPETTTIYAEEGTLAHEFAALILRFFIGDFAGREDEFNKRYVAHYTNVVEWYEINKPLELNPTGLANQMLMYAESYARFVFDIGGTIWVEEPLDLSRFIPLSWGTSDSLNLFADVLYVNDFKFGEGVRIYAEDNPQLKGYALGAYLRAVERGYDPHTIVMNIIQPRMSSEPSTAQISVTDLLKWAADTVAPQAQLAIAGQGAFMPGDHCQWCKANTCCAAFYAKFSEAWGLQDPRVMTAEQTAFILQYGDVLTGFIKRVKTDAVKRLRANERIPGFKLIATLGDRRFTDEVAVANALINLGYDESAIYKPTSLRGITELETMLKPKLFKEALGPWVTRPEGNPKLVPEDHIMPGIKTAGADLYDAPDLTTQL